MTSTFETDWAALGLNPAMGKTAFDWKFDPEPEKKLTRADKNREKSKAYFKAHYVPVAQRVKELTEFLAKGGEINLTQINIEQLISGHMGEDYYQAERGVLEPSKEYSLIDVIDGEFEVGNRNIIVDTGDDHTLIHTAQALDILSDRTSDTGVSHTGTCQ